MKFSRKGNKRSVDRLGKKISKGDFSMKINEGKKKFRLSFIKNLIWSKKKDTPTVKLPDIEDLENEFMFTLKKINNKLENDSCRDYSSRRLLVTRSIDDLARTSRQRYRDSSISSPIVHQSLFKPMVRQPNVSSTMIPRCQIVNNQTRLPSFENSLKLNNPAIIDIDHQSNCTLTKSLEKSHSSPLPMNRNQSAMTNNPIESAHLIDQYSDENKNSVCAYSCVSEVGENQSMESISSEEESVRRTLLQYDKRNLRHRWSFLDIWKTTMTNLPPIWNRIQRKQLQRTGSREFLLEYEEILPTNNNNNHHSANSTQEQRYVEQERPIHSHIGLALLALMVFPPVGIIAFVFSIWSLCGQQDRHLSRKFGHTVYWISVLAIGFSFLLLLSLLTYFTYQYLTTHRTDRSINKSVNYI